MMNSPLEKVLAALPEARRSGDNYSAHCPCHEDRNASLSIGVGDDGRVLIHDHAGCETEAIVSKLGLSMADLMPSSNGHAISNGKPKGSKKTYATAAEAIAVLESKRGPAAAKWPYHDASGKIISWALRWNFPAGGKTFLPVSQFDDGRKTLGMPEPRPMYGLPEIIAADRVYVFEGEGCADAGRSIGLPSTTAAHGAKSPGKTDWAPLAGKLVSIFPDNDSPGREYAETVAGILAKLEPPARVKIVELPGLPEGGDIVEWIDGHGDACEPDEFCRQIDALVEAAPVWQPSAKAKRKKTRPKPSIVGTISAGDVPIIDADEKDLATITPQAVAARSGQ